jgi:simple sugar transport system permease protein
MNDIEVILASAIRLAAPLAFAACGEYIVERSGALLISLEAMLLGGAFFGILGSSVFGDPTMGLVVGSLAGLVIAAVHANMSFRLHTNMFVVGLTLNALLLGLTSYLLEIVEMDPVQPGRIAVPLLSDIPVIGEAVFHHKWPVYLLIPVAVFSWWVIARTRWGLEVRSAGEDPESADVTGIDVNKRRRQTILICGLLAGLGGAYLSVAEVGVFNQNMTAGRGFIVNAAVIFGGWRIGGVLAGAFMFGLVDAARLALPALGYRITPQLLIAAPYVTAMVAMLFLSARSHRPRALARVFQRAT